MLIMVPLLTPDFRNPYPCQGCNANPPLGERDLRADSGGHTGALQKKPGSPIAGCIERTAPDLGAATRAIAFPCGCCTIAPLMFRPSIDRSVIIVVA